MKKILLIVDMEGCLGVFDMANYVESQQLMIAEVEYLLRFLAVKYKYDVTVVDSHDSGMNVMVLKDKFPCVPFVSHVWNITNIETYDAAVMIGFHARRNVPGWFSHTFRPEIADVMLGSRIVGEIELNANLLAFYQVPVYCVTGDEGARVEAQNICADFIPTKCLSADTTPVVNSYEELTMMILSILQTEPREKYLYSNEMVKLAFHEMDYQKYLPDSLFCKESNGVIFRNTIEFYQKAYGLCMYLNAYNKMRYDALYRIRNAIITEYSKEEFSRIPNTLLHEVLNSDINSISLSEINLVREIIVEYSKKKNWTLLLSDN